MEPDAALPLTFGALLLAGELGSVSVIRGAGGGLVSTVKERDTTGLSLPGASIALTEKVWRPSTRGARVCGELQGLNGRPSKRQTKVDPASSERKEKRGVRSLVKLPGPGPEVILARGRSASAVKLRKAP